MTVLGLTRLVHFFYGICTFTVLVFFFSVFKALVLVLMRGFSVFPGLVPAFSECNYKMFCIHGISSSILQL